MRNNPALLKIKARLLDFGTSRLGEKNEAADGHQRDGVSRTMERRINGHETAFRFGLSIQSNEKGESVG